MLRRLADKLILRPTQHAIATEDKVRRLIPFGGDHFEVWSQRATVEPGREPELFVLKFPGTGGRAERATVHPCECWGDRNAEVWAVNPPGYGGSSGRASLVAMAEMAWTALEHIQRAAAGRPLVVTGNSLGTVAALLVAARGQVDGLLLRNPPPLRQLIVGRFGWWNLRMAAALIARQVPLELDSLQNAAQVRVPAVFVSSGRDRIVPPRYQQQVIDAYAGEKRVLVLPEADHACPLKSHEEASYLEMLHWLRRKVANRGLANMG